VSVLLLTKNNYSCQYHQHPQEPRVNNHRSNPRVGSSRCRRSCTASARCSFGIAGCDGGWGRRSINGLGSSSCGRWPEWPEGHRTMPAQLTNWVNKSVAFVPAANWQL